MLSRVRPLSRLAMSELTSLLFSSGNLVSGDVDTDTATR